MSEISCNLYGAEASIRDRKGKFNYCVNQEVVKGDLMITLSAPSTDEVVTISHPVLPVSLAHPSLHWGNVLFKSGLVALSTEALFPVLHGLRPRQTYACFSEKGVATFVDFCEQHDLYLFQRTENGQVGWICRKHERLEDRIMTYSEWKLVLTAVYQGIHEEPLPADFDSRWEERWQLPLPQFIESLTMRYIPEIEERLMDLLLDGHPFEMAFSTEKRDQHLEKMFERERLKPWGWVLKVGGTFAFSVGSFLAINLPFQGPLTTVQKIVIGVSLGLVTAALQTVNLLHYQKDLEQNIAKIKAEQP